MAHLTKSTGTDPDGKAGWRARAACLQFDSALFFPDRVTYLKKDVGTAKAICFRCPVREECLQTALDSGERVGIWGGLTPVERANLHRRQRRVRAQETSTEDR
ncbi:WhiB family transcriptional regulator [Actinoallomurus sp. CA-142502]|uniref:WhiB family transcriptional regulator n=1 Tax=Actinoallomurus sp. CA-142502 TaxID=3239885 RepID=UPI003D8B8A42